MAKSPVPTKAIASLAEMLKPSHVLSALLHAFLIAVVGLIVVAPWPHTPQGVTTALLVIVCVLVLGIGGAYTYLFIWHREELATHEDRRKDRQERRKDEIVRRGLKGGGGKRAEALVQTAADREIAKAFDQDSEGGT